LLKGYAVPFSSIQLIVHPHWNELQDALLAQRQECAGYSGLKAGRLKISIDYGELNLSN
jgi:hypothetical protein